MEDQASAHESPKKEHRREYVKRRLAEIRCEQKKCNPKPQNPPTLRGFISGSGSSREGRFSKTHTEKPRP